MTEKNSKPFVWHRKHQNSEDVHDSIQNITRGVLISFGVIGALLVTVLLTFHIEISMVFRNLVYGEPIIIKRPISIVRNVPIFHKDAIDSSPISVDVPVEINRNPTSNHTTPAPTPSEVTKIGSYTYQVRIGSDERMATPTEIRDALNEYRNTHGKSELKWDEVLGQYAQTRAKYFSDNQILDEHEGFRRFVNNDNGFEKLGFDSLGENSAYLSGGELMAGTIIEKLFASDIYHDNNQLDTKWTHIGVGIEGLAINVIFGGNKTE